MELKLYNNGKREIVATEKAYAVIYKKDGFIPGGIKKKKK